GLTMAVAVGISLLNAMTLSPALCALIMSPHDMEGKNSFSSRFHLAFETSVKRIVGKYTEGVKFMISRKWLTALLLVVACGGLGYMMMTTKTGLVPQEDMGSINIDVQTPAGTNLGETMKLIEEIDRRITDIPQIKVFSKTAGAGMMSGTGSSCGMFNIRLKDWKERKGKGDDVNSVIDEIYRRTADITGAKIIVFTRNMIPGYGVSNGFEIHVQDQKGGSIEDLKQITNNIISELGKRPEIARASTSFDTKYPQYLVEVDAANALRHGVQPGDVLDALSGYIGGTYASNINRFSKLYRVMVQASPEFRLDTKALSNIFVRNASGDMSPISQYLKLKRIYGAQTLSRFNLFSSIQVNGTPATGYSSGEAIKAVREVCAEFLPAGYGYEFGGMSREEASTGKSTAFIFVVCIIFIYLILCALYESIFIPWAVLLSVPFGLAGSFFFARLFGLENNIYLQIGLLMLIG
ncbi:MAG: efflux RND transporter permease subunit, partial [Bacteroidales bacterium]|nr:efflux RND transporter permease subunit [Bacteroidales bacterium]